MSDWLPPVVDPGPAGPPAPVPSDAVVLFDGRDMAGWTTTKGAPAKWVVRDGYMEAVKGAGSIQTERVFGDCQLHLEFEAPEVVKGVEFMAKAVGTESAAMPRGYLIPAEYAFIADKLRIHGVKIDVLTKPLKASGEQFVIDQIDRGRGGDYSANNMVRLSGGFAPSPAKEFPAGTFRIDLAQPLANLAFYCLEPQAADGFVGWGVFDDWLRSVDAGKRSVVYPVYKYFKISE